MEQVYPAFVSTCGNKPVEQSLGSLGEIGGPAQSVHFQNIGDHNSATKLFASLHLFQAWGIRLFVQLASTSQESILYADNVPKLGCNLRVSCQKLLEDNHCINCNKSWRGGHNCVTKQLLLQMQRRDEHDASKI